MTLLTDGYQHMNLIIQAFNHSPFNQEMVNLAGNIYHLNVPGLQG